MLRNGASRAPRCQPQGRRCRADRQSFCGRCQSCPVPQRQGRHQAASDRARRQDFIQESGTILSRDWRSALWPQCAAT
jgi:hypothetical protein